MSFPDGHLTADLRDLTEAGFVTSFAGLNPKTAAPLRKVRYLLSDNYIRFYLKFIVPIERLLRN